MSVSLPVEVDFAHRRHLLGGEPMIFHCHHYNAFLLQTILDAQFVDARPFLEGAGAEVAHAQLSKLFAAGNVDAVDARKQLAQELYRWAGFGTFDLAPLQERGGEVTTWSSHYARAWRAKFGAAAKPVCFFAAGWLAGATAAIFGRPAGSYHVEHSRCTAVDAGAACRFEVLQGGAGPVFQSVGLGALSTHKPHPVPPTAVDYEGILQAVSGLPLGGDAKGEINAFGVYLTHMYANYYNRISFELLRNAVGQFGEEGRATVEPLLVEAGHVCAFNTLGGIMTSTEWDALIRPTLKSQEDWVHGSIAVINAFGWGRWQVTEVSRERATFVLHDDYEGVGHLAMYGKAAHPVEYLAFGGAIGLMNLVYVGEIEKRPELTPLFYNHLFRKERHYQGKVLSSRGMGGDVTSIQVSRV